MLKTFSLFLFLWVVSWLVFPLWRIPHSCYFIFLNRLFIILRYSFLLNLCVLPEPHRFLLFFVDWVSFQPVYSSSSWYVHRVSLVIIMAVVIFSALPQSSRSDLKRKIGYLSKDFFRLKIFRRNLLLFHQCRYYLYQGFSRVERLPSAP